MKVKDGQVLYSIEMNGCLNGVYTNENVGPPVGEIFNEIARLKRTPEDWPTNLSGIYDCFYFDLNNDRGNGTLEIIATGNAHHLIWRDLRGAPVFEGKGYRMNNHQLAAHYWSK